MRRPRPLATSLPRIRGWCIKLNLEGDLLKATNATAPVAGRHNPSFIILVCKMVYPKEIYAVMHRSKIRLT